jgi:EmrB/QacA subfamily drug resistance transporter
MDRTKLLVVLPVSTAMFLGALDATLVGTAMPTVIASLGGLHLYAWVFAIYTLTVTAAMPVLGRLSDLYGRRTLFLVAVGIFTAGSALCGMAQSILHLIIARAIQGVGGGGIFALSQAIFGEIFPPRERARMQGFLASTWGIASLVGPMAGGLFADYLGWRWAFLVNVPLGVAASVMIARGLRGTLHAGTPGRVDYAGAATMFTCIVALQLGCLELGAGRSLADASAGGLLLASLLLGTGFVLVECRSGDPMLPLSLFRSRLFSVSIASGVLAGMAMFGAISFLPLFVQGVLGRSATAAGSVMMGLILSWTSGSGFLGRYLNRLGFRRMIVGGTSLITVGYGLVLRWGATTPLVVAGLSLIPMGMGMGIFTITSIVAVQAAARREHLGAVSSTPFFFRNIGATVGITIMGAILASHLPPDIASHMLSAGPRGHAVEASGLAVSGADPSAAPLLAAGLHSAFLFGLVCSVGAFLISLWMPNVSLTDDPAGSGEPPEPAIEIG